MKKTEQFVSTVVGSACADCHITRECGLFQNAELLPITCESQEPMGMLLGLDTDGDLTKEEKDELMVKYPSLAKVESRIGMAMSSSEVLNFIFNGDNSNKCGATYQDAISGCVNCGKCQLTEELLDPEIDKALDELVEKCKSVPGIEVVSVESIKKETECPVLYCEDCYLDCCLAGKKL